MPPAPDGDTCPRNLDQTKRPCALKKAVDGRGQASAGERQDEHRGAIFERVEKQGEGHCKETKGVEHRELGYCSHRVLDVERARGCTACPITRLEDLAAATPEPAVEVAGEMA